jgi:hypothetical protein
MNRRYFRVTFTDAPDTDPQTVGFWCWDADEADECFWYWVDHEYGTDAGLEILSIDLIKTGQG